MCLECRKEKDARDRAQALYRAAEQMMVEEANAIPPDVLEGAGAITSAVMYLIGYAIQYGRRPLRAGQHEEPTVADRFAVIEIGGGC